MELEKEKIPKKNWRDREIKIWEWFLMGFILMYLMHKFQNLEEYSKYYAQMIATTLGYIISTIVFYYSNDKKNKIGSILLGTLFFIISINFYTDIPYINNPSRVYLKNISIKVKKNSGKATTTKYYLRGYTKEGEYMSFSITNKQSKRKYTPSLVIYYLPNTKTIVDIKYSIDANKFIYRK